MNYNVQKLIYPALIVVISVGFFLTLHNTFDEKMYYRLEWDCHPHSYPFPYGIAAGELGPGEANIINREFTSGIYEIVWWSASYEDDYKMGIGFITTDKTRAVLTTPEGVELE